MPTTSPNFHEEETITTEMNEFEQLNDLRARVLAGEEIPAAEYEKVISSLRRSRTALPAVKAPTRAKKGEAIIDPNKVLKRDDKTAAADALFDEEE
jgi:hypothetical protein